MTDVEKRIEQRGGNWGFRSLRLAMSSFDKSGEGFLTKEDVCASLNAYGVFISDGPELVNFLRPFANAKNIFSIFDVMRAIDGQILRETIRVICDAYEVIQRAFGSDKSGSPQPTVDFICKAVRIDRHPDVEKGLVTLRDALFCYFALWGAPLSESVTQQLFVEFHCDLIARSGSKGIEMIRKLYNLDSQQTISDLQSDYAIVPNQGSSDRLFEQIDANRNGKLSLAELDLAVLRLWPRFDFKPAIMRAYKLADDNGNGLLSKKEFFKFLHYLVAYNQLLKDFKRVDSNGDGNVSFEELRASKKFLNLGNVSDGEVREVFRAMDANNGGKVRFEEFAVFMAKKKGDESLAKFTNVY